MKAFIRSALTKYPVAFATVQAVRGRWRGWRQFHAMTTNVREKLYGAGEIHVLTGPFAGLQYLDSLVWGIISNKWLGTYEAELHSIVEEIIARPYEKILDVGCAEGWYAVGLTWRMPQSQMIAYDIDPISRRQCRKLAEINGVSERVEIKSFCTSEELQRFDQGRVLLVCDIEGGERFLLDPVQSPVLKEMDVLVEVHETEETNHDCETLLQGRFQATHEIRRIGARVQMSEAELQSVAPQLSVELKRAAVNEHRSNGHTWLWMQSRTHLVEGTFHGAQNFLSGENQ